jgi:hypothetical protein
MLVSSFTLFLLEEGVEMELPVELSEAISILIQEVPQFACEGYGYELAGVGRAQLGSRWDLLVKLAILATKEVIPTAVGRIELEKIDDHSSRLRIPPRAEQDYPEAMEFDPDGRYYGSLISQTLNALYRRQLIELPAALPLT